MSSNPNPQPEESPSRASLLARKQRVHEEAQADIKRLNPRALELMLARMQDSPSAEELRTCRSSATSSVF